MDPCSQLIRFINERPEILLDRSRMSALLNDVFPTKRDTVNILLILYFDLQIHFELERTSKTDVFFISRIAKKLNNDYQIDLDAGKKCVEIWIECLKGIHSPERANKCIDTSTQLEENDEQGIFCPCGVGIHDNGFYVIGVENNNQPCEHPLASVYSIILGILQRNLDVKKSLLHIEIEKREHHNYFYNRIYRLEILVLLLIKNNYIRDDLINVDISDWTEGELLFAVNSINEYVSVICSLTNLKPNRMKVNFSETAALKICRQRGAGGVCVVDSHKRVTRERIIWIAPNIQYSINESEKTNLEMLLREILGYEKFLDGQFEAIRDILNSQTSKLCVMPTGSGKSLIFYFTVLLQPCPSIILCPTTILIHDQCDILKNNHEIDDIQIMGDQDIPDRFHPANKFIYITPMTLMSKKFLLSIIQLNIDQHIANFVLDEVHCISNWSHDFRPEYLMLSFNLRYYVDKTRLLCFTATANYTVVKDLMIQLNLKECESDIITPLELGRRYQKYSLLPQVSDEMSLSNVSNNIDDFLQHNTGKTRQLLIFTKSNQISRQLKANLNDEISHEVEVYSSNDVNSYNNFANNQYQVLIGDSDVGIGINLPGVTDTLHYGVPISKSQFVQEIGRAGRLSQEATAKVLYRNINSLKPEQDVLLHRNTKVADIIDFIKQSDINDEFTQTFLKIFGGVESQEEYLEGVLFVFNKIKAIKNSAEIKLRIDRNEYFEGNLIKYFRYLYVLYRIGYLFNWYVEEQNRDDGYVSFFVEISEDTTLVYLKGFSAKYLLHMGNYKKAVEKIRQSRTIEELIENYITWHYDQFLYHHREQFMEMYDFLEFYNNSTNQQISSALNQYFSLSLINIESATFKYSSLSIIDIYRYVLNGVDADVISDVQKSLENEYSGKLDFLLFLYNAMYLNQTDISRFNRIVDNLLDVDFLEMTGIIDHVYSGCTPEGKFKMISGLCKRLPLLKVINTIYNKIDEDIVYYAILSKCCNFQMRKNGQSN